MTLIVNMYGAPSSGKSTTATGVFSALKLNGVNAEYVSEVAKDFTWEKRDLALACQPYVFGKQLRNMFRLLDKVSVIITDSPMFLSAFYARKYQYDVVLTDKFVDFVYEQSKKYDTGLNYLINRVKPYNPIGRNQTEEEAKQIASEMKYMLKLFNIKFQDVDGNAETIKMITNDILERL